jgi:hypothetical protein
MGKPYDHSQDPFPFQLQAEGQGQGQLEGQGQGELQGQGQYQSALDANLNGNGNLNENFNTDAATAVAQATSEVDVQVDVAVAASLTPAIDLNIGPDSSLLYMPQEWSQTISGGVTATEIALDQVNSLIANNSSDGNSVSNTGSGMFDHDHLGNGVSADASASSGDWAAGSTGSDSATASPSATLDAFTQSIVLGANIQYNNFNTSVVGHDNITTSGDGLHHS